MDEVLAKAREFILTNARLLERRLFQVHFEGESPDCIGQIVRAYQNSDGGLGHALEPDVRIIDFRFFRYYCQTIRRGVYSFNHIFIREQVLYWQGGSQYWMRR